MAKHQDRCSVCSRYVTHADMSDDGMCANCANRIDTLVDRRTANYRLIIKMLIALLIMSAVSASALLSECAYGGDSEFIEEYYVTGINLTTNERVVGWLDGVLGGTEISGYVLDRGEHYVVVGTANGKGSFELRSLCCEYDVTVADEVTQDKIYNRKQGQETWK